MSQVSARADLVQLLWGRERVGAASHGTTPLGPGPALRSRPHQALSSFGFPLARAWRGLVREAPVAAEQRNLELEPGAFHVALCLPVGCEPGVFAGGRVMRVGGTQVLGGKSWPQCVAAARDEGGKPQEYDHIPCATRRELAERGVVRVVAAPAPEVSRADVRGSLLGPVPQTVPPQGNRCRVHGAAASGFANRLEDQTL